MAISLHIIPNSNKKKKEKKNRKLDRKMLKTNFYIIKINIMFEYKVLEHGCQSKNRRLFITHQKPSTHHLSISFAG